MQDRRFGPGSPHRLGHQERRAGTHLRASFALVLDLAKLTCNSQSDDMLIFQNPPSKEYSTALSILAGGRRQLVDIVRRGIDATFAGAEERSWMRDRLDSFSKTALHA